MIFWFQLLGPLDSLTYSLLTLNYGGFNLRRVWVVPKRPQVWMTGRNCWKIAIETTKSLQSASSYSYGKRGGADSLKKPVPHLSKIGSGGCRLLRLTVRCGNISRHQDNTASIRCGFESGGERSLVKLLGHGSHDGQIHAAHQFYMVSG